MTKKQVVRYSNSTLNPSRRSLINQFKKVLTPSNIKTAIKMGKSVAKKIKSVYKKKPTIKNRLRVAMTKIEQSSHNDMTVHPMMNVVLKGKPYLGKTTSKLTHQEDYQACNSIGQGYQAVDLLEHIANHPKLTGGTNSDRTQANYSVFNVYKLQTAAGRVNMNTNTFDNTPSQMRLYYESVTASYEFVSLVNIPILVELYLCSPKFDTSYNPVEVWNAATVNDSQAYGTQAQGQTVYSTTTTTPGYAAQNTYGNKPTHYRDFNQQWSVVGRKTFILQPGDQRIYKHKIWIKKAISVAMFEKRNSFFKAGYSVVPLVVAKGGAIGLSSDDPSDAGQCAHGPVKYGVICNYKHNFKSIPESQYNAHIIEENLTVNQSAARIKIVDDNDEVATYKDA